MCVCVSVCGVWVLVCGRCVCVGACVCGCAHVFVLVNSCKMGVSVWVYMCVCV